MSSDEYKLVVYRNSFTVILWSRRELGPRFFVKVIHLHNTSWRNIHAQSPIDIHISCNDSCSGIGGSNG